jgi:hypothetical protein
MGAKSLSVKKKKKKVKYICASLKAPTGCYRVYRVSGTIDVEITDYPTVDGVGDVEIEAGSVFVNLATGGTEQLYTSVMPPEANELLLKILRVVK